MQDVKVFLWVGDRDDVVEYVVSVEGGVTDTEVAIEKAKERATADGYDDLNLKEVKTV